MWYVGDVPIVAHNHGLIVSEFLFTSLAVLAVCLRVFTRSILVKNVGIDDFFITAAMFGTISFLVSAIYQIKFGLGRAPEGPPDLSIIQKFLQSLLATIVSYSFTHLAVKFSILLQCKRIFVARSAQRVFLVLLVWMVFYGLFCLLSSIITCWPIAKYWDDTIPGGCINRSKLHYVLAGFNIANDVALLVSPLPYLNSLQIARRAKMILIGLFSLGGFACIVAIVRLHSLYVNNSAPIDQQPVKGVDIAIWSGLEINISIICASIPAIKPLFVKFFPKLISNITDSTKRSRTRDRSARGSFPLRSLTRSADTEMHSGGIEIKVQQSFEMKAVAADGDDDSEKNLVMGGNQSLWSAECYSSGPRDGHAK